ncbi:sensor histidine kinase [Alteromonas sediminis]|nr:ATP-binding protein [Alteromonas sediminis]
MKFHSLRWKITGLVLLVVLSFNFLMQFAIWLIESSHRDIGNRPIKDWLDNALIHPAERRLEQGNSESITTLLSHYCNRPTQAITHAGQHYASITINDLYLLDEQGNYVWSCDPSLPKFNAFMHLPIASRDDVADAIVGRFNSGVEQLEGDDYLVVKGVYQPNGAVYRVLVSQQTWQRNQQFSKLLYYPVEILDRGLSWSAASLLIGFLPALCLAFLIASRISKKVREITQVIGQWAAGNFSARLKVTAKDDTGKALSQLNQMAEDIRRLVEQKQALAEKSERQRIAAELHDTVKQLLYANNLQLAGASASLGQDNDKAALILSEAIKTNKKAFNNINLLIEALKPIDWDHTTLSTALKQELARWRSDKPIELDVKIEDDIALSPDQSYVFYRCVHEALQNVVKHSQAKQVDVALNKQDGQIICTISDDGIGLSEGKGEGQGLVLMRSRLEAIKGTLSITSGQGCTVTITLEAQS